MKTNWIIIAMLIAGTSLFSGCGSKEATESAETSKPSNGNSFADLFAPVGAEEAETITALRAKAKPGEQVTLVGKVMGMMEPFVPNRAAFVAGDEETLVSCELLGDENHCPTPWDVCCEDPGKIRASTATIQVVNENGDVIKQEIRGVNGLKELSRIRVRGVVAPQSSDEVLIVNAERIELL